MGNEVVVKEFGLQCHKLVPLAWSDLFPFLDAYGVFVILETRLMEPQTMGKAK
jgi:hypothetical protein